MQPLLRTRYYQRAFRAITTGHSNRRRTQIADFEVIELAFPPEPEEQRRLIAGITHASGSIRAADEALRRELHAFSSVIDGRGDEELPEVDEEANKRRTRVTLRLSWQTDEMSMKTMVSTPSGE